MSPAQFSAGAAIGELAPDLFGEATLGEGVILGLVDRVESAPDVVELLPLKLGVDRPWDVLETDAGGRVVSPLTMLASPASDSVLFAWSELAEGASKRTIRVARLDCLVAP